MKINFYVYKIFLFQIEIAWSAWNGGVSVRVVQSPSTNSSIVSSLKWMNYDGKLGKSQIKLII